MQQNGNCSLCGAEYGNFGNNPDPIGDHDWRVCDDCNERFVIPARMGLYTRAQIDALLSLTAAHSVA